MIFVDYGNLRRTRMDELKVLPDAFRRLSPAAIHCTLPITRIRSVCLFTATLPNRFLPHPYQKCQPRFCPESGLTFLIGMFNSFLNKTIFIIMAILTAPIHLKNEIKLRRPIDIE